MKEVLTRSFWQGVKKTFYDALEGPPAPRDNALQSPAAGSFEAPSTSDPPPSAIREQDGSVTAPKE